MNSQTFGRLLTRDIDDLTALAGRLDHDSRSALLKSAAEALSDRRRPFRLKLVRFVQALASPEEGYIQSDAANEAASALIQTAHADDPGDRLAALRALAVVIANVQMVEEMLARSILATFEQARTDSSDEIRRFADEVLSQDYLSKILTAPTGNAGELRAPLSHPTGRKT